MPPADNLLTILYAAMNASPVKVRRALISVADKSGLEPFAKALSEWGIALISTGGSARVLAAAGISVTEVAAVTGMPEFLDGRVKTLHPAIYAGLLARRDRPDHMAALADRSIDTIDLAGLQPLSVRGNGRQWCNPRGVYRKYRYWRAALIRAAAKNHDAVTVVTDPGDYDRVLAELSAGAASIAAPFRRALARKAYAMTAAYDAAIAAWMAGEEDQSLPEQFVASGNLAQRLRYGENPHQAAVSIAPPKSAPAWQRRASCKARSCLTTTIQMRTRLSSWLPSSISRRSRSSNTPIPVVSLSARHSHEAWNKALACDPVSAFGGVVALNRSLDLATAEAIRRLFVEVVIAPAVDPEAAARLASRNALRLLVTGALPDPTRPASRFRSVAGGLLVQERDRAVLGADRLRVVTRRAPTDAEIADLLFADRVVKHVKSNAIVFARNGATVGIGAGQMSRVDSVRLAADKAAEISRAAGSAVPPTRGAVLASDAFFPFADGLEAAIAAGATAVIQPGGSVRDPEVIAAADAAGIAMVFTGIRRFRH